jgi:hypothetical protein
MSRRLWVVLTVFVCAHGFPISAYCQGLSDSASDLVYPIEAAIEDEPIGASVGTVLASPLADGPRPPSLPWDFNPDLSNVPPRTFSPTGSETDLSDP